MWEWNWGSFDKRNIPVAYLSKALSDKNQRLSIYDKEFLALMLAIERWRPYLQRAEFIIKTNYKALSFLDNQVMHSDLQRKARARLMGLHFKILYKKGKENLVADALSRVGHCMALQAVSEVQPLWIQEVINSYVIDEEAQQLMSQLLLHSPDEQGFSLYQGFIRKGSQIWIANNTALRTKIIVALHYSVVGGHSGGQATYHRIKRLFWWRGLKADVISFIKQGNNFQQAKGDRIHCPGLLQPLPIPQGAWQYLTMDFIEGLPKSEGYDSILVVVDRFSKYGHFTSETPFLSFKGSSSILRQHSKTAWNPKSLVTDRDNIY